MNGLYEKLKNHLVEVAWADAPPLTYGQLPVSFNADDFTLYRAVDGAGADTGLFTGYYEPELQGAFAPSDVYRFPIYGLPVDPTAFTRAEINAGALKNQKLELLYCADAVDLFFMHIQGSGVVQLPNGKQQRVTFAGKNGRPYTAIGKVLRERGVLSAPVTMQAIRSYLAAHPDAAQSIMEENASYIFFRLLDADVTGPLGAAGHVLQPLKHLAVDRGIWPYGLDVIVETTHPLTGAPFVQHMQTADTGSAIVGAVRGDVFFGAGNEAAQLAGSMQQQGRMWVILRK